MGFGGLWFAVVPEQKNQIKGLIEQLHKMILMSGAAHRQVQRPGCRPFPRAGPDQRPPRY